MGKMSELDLTLKELKEHADAINALVNDLYDLFSSKPTDKEEKKEEKKPLTLEEVRTKQDLVQHNLHKEIWCK